MTHFSEKLDRLKSELKVVEDQEVAALLDMAKAAFSGRKKRDAFPDEKLYALAAKRPDLSIDVDYVLHGVEDTVRKVRADHGEGSRRAVAALHEQLARRDAAPEVTEEESLRQRAELHRRGGISSDDIAPDWSAYLQIPRYDVQASAGPGSLVSGENVVDHMVFKRDWIVRSLGLDPEALALIDVRGDSMAPTINDGDVILLDTRLDRQTTEGIYAINLAERLLVKRLRLRLSGVIEVISDNARYGTETIDGDQLSQLHIIGRVVWQGRRI